MIFTNRQKEDPADHADPTRRSMYRSCRSYGSHTANICRSYRSYRCHTRKTCSMKYLDHTDPTQANMCERSVSYRTPEINTT